MLPGREENGAQTPARKLGEKAPAAPALPVRPFSYGAQRSPRFGAGQKSLYKSADT